MDVEFKITGADDILRKLAGLADNVQRNAARRAARAGMNIVRDAARRNAEAIDDKDTAERISKNIVTQESSRASRAEGGVVMRVGVRGGASPTRGDVSGLAGGDTRHWRFIEFGTEKTPARPFMLPAFTANIDAVTSRVVAELNAALDKLAL